jgi:hypothetical protein
MRGSTRIGLMAISLVCMFAFMVATAFGDADDQLLNQKAGVALRDVASTPTNQPDAAEFVNNGNVVLETSLGTITCTEEEFGATVLKNKPGEVELAIPFGVAEGQDCTSPLGEVPTYFDTLATGAVGNSANSKVASVSIADTGAGTKIVATMHNLKFSQKIGTIFCTGNLDGIVGEVTNSEGPFVEEEKPNLNVQFTAQKVAVAGEAGCPTEGKLTANFFLETPSTGTDTAWFNS